MLTEEIEEGTPWAMLFVDDLALCDPDKEKMEVRLERWSECMETNGIQVSRVKQNTYRQQGIQIRLG